MVILKFLVAFSVGVSGILFLPDHALAWGVGVHIGHGTYILKHLNLIAPEIATILEAYSYDYLYGCMSADIFIGKGTKKRWDHCHNWSVGKKMLSIASSYESIAFVYGYLTHLAADIISHNYYIPTQLYMTSSTKRIGHIYWEFRSDEYVDKSIWKTAKTVIGRHNHHNDEFLQEVIKRKLISFKVKKRIFSQSVKVNDLTLWRKAVAVVSKKSRWELDGNYIEELNRHSLNLIIDFLRKGEKAICFKYDPVGSDTLASAKIKRKADRIARGTKPKRTVFKVSAEIKKLSYIKSAKTL